ncbi:hypothetical protein K2Z84_05320 [Candidatus Binatia bacterium]|nr:hypothetical protein [Candidatus Binatia bacterium]
MTWPLACVGVVLAMLALRFGALLRDAWRGPRWDFTPSEFFEVVFAPNDWRWHHDYSIDALRRAFAIPRHMLEPKPRLVYSWHEMPVVDWPEPEPEPPRSSLFDTWTPPFFGDRLLIEWERREKSLPRLLSFVLPMGWR